MGTGHRFLYSADISIDRNRLGVERRRLDLTPSMAVTVEIKTGACRAIEYLLSPLSRYKQEGLRE
jgi:hemolysin D